MLALRQNEAPPPLRTKKSAYCGRGKVRSDAEALELDALELDALELDALELDADALELDALAPAPAANGACSASATPGLESTARSAACTPIAASRSAPVAARAARRAAHFRACATLSSSASRSAERAARRSWSKSVEPSPTGAACARGTGDGGIADAGTDAAGGTGGTPVPGRATKEEEEEEAEEAAAGTASGNPSLAGTASGNPSLERRTSRAWR